MAYITNKSRYKEYGLVAYYEYDETSRMLDSIPKKRVPTTLLRPTSYISLIELITHTIKQGETIHKLALHYYGNAALWWFIADYNPLLDANGLKEGDKVLIPPLTEVNSY